MFFARSKPVAVSNTVSHSAVWEMQSVGQVLRSGRPAAVANKNPRSINKKIIASRNDRPSFLFWKKVWGKCKRSSAWQADIWFVNMYHQMVVCAAFKGDVFVENWTYLSSLHVPLWHLQKLAPSSTCTVRFFRRCMTFIIFTYLIQGHH